jgi:lysophospholipase L1-like esterase
MSQYMSIGYNRTRAQNRLSVGVVAGAMCSMLIVVITIVRPHGCTCSALPACRSWSCDAPLANSLHDEWPSWPPAAEADRQLPRDNLPNAEAEARWLALHREHAAAVAKVPSATRIAFLGDSLTEGWIRSGFSGRAASVAQPQCERIWHETFGRFNPLNLAIGGDRVQDLGWRLQHGLLPAGFDPAVFFVLIGTNDLGSGEEWHVVADELQLMLEQLHAKRPEAVVLVHALLPRGGDDGHMPTAQRPVVRSPWWSARSNNHYHGITSINARLHALASGHKHKHWLRYIDCSGPLLARAYSPADQLQEHAGKDTAQAQSVSPEQRYLPVHLFYDLLHLTPEGYMLWADCLAPHLASAKEGSKESGASPSAVPRGRQVSLPSRHGETITSAQSSALPDCVGRSCRGVPGEIDLA